MEYNLMAMIERRKCQRFLVKEPAFIEAFAQVGKIINISRAGLAFRYRADYGFRPGLSFPGGVLFGPGYYLDDVALTIIADQPADVIEPAISIDRRCCAQFELAPRRLWRLEYFIFRNTTPLSTGVQLCRARIKDALASCRWPDNKRPA